MKKMMLAVMVFAMSSFAQIGLDAGLEVGMPMGDFADAASMGFGGSIKMIYPINEQMDATGRIGYTMWTEEVDGLTWWTVPIMAGGRYKMTPEFYGMAEVGMTMIGYKIDIAGFTADDSETDLSFSVGAGYLMNQLDFSVFYNSIMMEEENADNIVLRVGYKFM